MSLSSAISGKEMKFPEGDDCAGFEDVLSEFRDSTSESYTSPSSDGKKRQAEAGAVESPPIFIPPRGFWQRKKKTLIAAACGIGGLILLGVGLMTHPKTYPMTSPEPTSPEPKSAETTSPETTYEHRETVTEE